MFEIAPGTSPRVGHHFPRNVVHLNGAKLPAPNQTLIANEANQPSGVAAVELHRTFNLWQYGAQADGCRSPPDSRHHAELCMHAFAESHAVILPFSPGRGAAFLLGERELELLARVEGERCRGIPLLCGTAAAPPG